MTRKDYIAIANLIGDAGRGMGDHTWQGTLNTACLHLIGTGKFDQARFMEWANEVRDRVRDIDGRKVA